MSVLIQLQQIQLQQILKKGLFIIVPAVFLWGCESTPEQEDTGVDEVVKVDSSPAPTPAPVDQGRTVQPIVQPALDPLDDPNSILSQRIVYFDYDQNEVNPEFREIIKAHAEYLASNPSTRITVEGNADERGTREYNIGLGDRRASAVRQLMVLQGATSSQVETISYGEERPADLGHNEDSWNKNRRVEIVYSSR